MMNIPPGEADRLSLWQYEALIYHWNKAHGTEEIEIVDPEITERMIDKLKANPEMLKRPNPRKKG